MKRYHAFVAMLGFFLLFAAGCEQTSIAQQEQIKSFETLVASTPSVTPTPTATDTPLPTAPPTNTIGPSPTPTQTPVPSATPVPTATPLPPTPTPNPALANFSVCNQTAGEADSGRFSAQLTTITTTVESAFERVTIGLNVPDDSAAPHATAACISANDAQSANTSGAYLLQVDLADWLHDDAFQATTISPTLALSGTTVLQNLSYQFDSRATVGASLVFGLAQPLPYRFTLEKNPYRLILEVAKDGAISANNDMLAVPATSDLTPDAPVFAIQDGDIWKFADGAATNLSKDARQDRYGAVTALDVDLATKRVAFCAVAPGTDVGDQLASSVLWSFDLDGKDALALAALNRTCADPQFSPDGGKIAFSADETGAIPPRLSIWIVSANGGDEQRVTAANDEWSRFSPQWLGSDQLVYSAVAEDGRNTLFVHNANDSEQDIGVDLVKGDRYRGFGRLLASPDGNIIAVEALRANAEGADLLLLGSDGALLPNQPVIGSDYWNRPLAWNADGTLFYLTSACPSTVAQSYTVHTRTSAGEDRLIALGTALGGFGEFSAADQGLVYVTLARVPAGPRGPLDIDRDSPSTLWFWDVGGSGLRSKLSDAPSAISALAP